MNNYNGLGWPNATIVKQHMGVTKKETFVYRQKHTPGKMKNQLSENESVKGQEGSIKDESIQRCPRSEEIDKFREADVATLRKAQFLGEIFKKTFSYMK